LNAGAPRPKCFFTDSRRLEPTGGTLAPNGMGLYYLLSDASRVGPKHPVLSFGKQNVHERAIESEDRPRAPLTLLAFLTASVALHAAVIVALPEFSLERAPLPVTVLEVVLVQTAPPRPLAVAESRPRPLPTPAPPVRRKEVKRRSTPESIPPSPAREAPPPLLTQTMPKPAREVAAPAERPEKIAASEITSSNLVAPIASVAPTTPRFSASYRQNPAPRYPLAARRAGEQGTVTLKVRVTSEGLPERVEVEKTSGSSRLDAAALDAVRQWRFVPARRGATPVESWVLVPVVFRLEEPS